MLLKKKKQKPRLPSALPKSRTGLDDLRRRIG